MCQASLDWVTLDDLEEHTHCHERVISSNAKLCYTLSDLRRRQGTSNSRNQRTRQRRTRKSGLVAPGPTLVRDLCAKQAALNISFNQQPASSSVAFIALAVFLCVCICGRLLPADATAACSMRAGTSATPAHIPGVAAACLGAHSAEKKYSRVMAY